MGFLSEKKKHKFKNILKTLSSLSSKKAGGKKKIFIYLCCCICQSVEFEGYVSLNHKYTTPLQVNPNIQSTLKGALQAYK